MQNVIVTLTNNKEKKIISNNVQNANNNTSVANLKSHISFLKWNGAELPKIREMPCIFKSRSFFPIWP